MTTIFLAEDQVILNTALATLLDLKDDFEVVSTSEDGQDALAQILTLKPDIAILDIEMPVMTGLNVVKQLKLLHSSTKVIILTTFAQENYFEEAVTTNVNGYLLKDHPSEKLIETIHAVMAGKTIFDSELVTHLIKVNKNPFTSREQSVLEALATGASTHEMAQRLFLFEGTLRNYISIILSKTDAKTRIEAVNYAKKEKWLES